MYVSPGLFYFQQFIFKKFKSSDGSEKCNLKGLLEEVNSPIFDVTLDQILAFGILCIFWEAHIDKFAI